MTDDNNSPHDSVSALAAQLIDQTSRLSDAGMDTAGPAPVLETMMEAVPVGIVITDATGKIVHGNKHVEELVRHPVLFSNDAESYGEWISYHSDGRQVASDEYPLSRIIKDGEDSAELEVHYQRGDGTRFWMRIIGRAVRGADDELIGATVALIDIDREKKLQRSQEILIAELNHRVKNAFSVTMAIVRRSLDGANISADVIGAIAKRLDAYAKVHSRLVGTDWGFAKLGRVAADVLQPIAGDNITFEGPVVEMPSQMGISLSMAFYELVTNASKYGALSVEGGKIALQWGVDNTKTPEQIFINWREIGGPVAKEPSAPGFGTFITQRAVAAGTNGVVEVSYKHTGFEWKLTMPKPEESSEAR